MPPIPLLARVPLARKLQEMESLEISSLPLLAKLLHLCLLGFFPYYKMISVCKHARITQQVRPEVIPEHEAKEEKKNNDAI